MAKDQLWAQWISDRACIGQIDTNQVFIHLGDNIIARGVINNAHDFVTGFHLHIAEVGKLGPRSPSDTRYDLRMNQVYCLEGRWLEEEYLWPGVVLHDTYQNSTKELTQVKEEFRDKVKRGLTPSGLVFGFKTKWNWQKEEKEKRERERENAQREEQEYEARIKKLKQEDREEEDDGSIDSAPWKRVL